MTVRAPIILLVVLAAIRGAVADPSTSRVITAPTAWLLERGSVSATAAIDHRGHGTAIAGYGLGG